MLIELEKNPKVMFLNHCNKMKKTLIISLFLQLSYRLNIMLKDYTRVRESRTHNRDSNYKIRNRNSRFNIKIKQPNHAYEFCILATPIYSK